MSENSLFSNFRLPSLLLFTGVTAIFIVLSGCGQKQPKVLEIEGFENYVTTFQEIASARGIDASIDSLVIRLGDLESGYGECTINSVEPPTITLQSDYWESASELEREQTIYHELGHCILRRVHDPHTDTSGVPLSLMHPNKLHLADYSRYRDELIEELFSVTDEF